MALARGGEGCLSAGGKAGAARIELLRLGRLNLDAFVLSILVALNLALW